MGVLPIVVVYGRKIPLGGGIVVTSSLYATVAIPV
jgi:hypothetical protein